MKFITSIKSWVPFVLLGILILPFLLLNLYNLPSYDDYYYAEMLNRHGVFGSQQYFYLNWSGRYTATFLLLFTNPLSYVSLGIPYYGVLSTIIILAFLVGLYWFISSMISTKNIVQRVGIFTGFLFLFLFLMPSTFEGFYWHSGAYTYTAGMILCLLSASLLIKNKWQISKRHRGLVMLLSILIPGTSEVVNLIFIACFLLFLFLKYLRDKSVPPFLLVVLGLLVLGTLASFLAPGNGVRAQSVVDSGKVSKDFVQVGMMSVKLGVKQIMQWLISGPFFLFAFLCLSVKQYISKDLITLVNSPLKFLIWLLTLTGIFFFVFFMVMWSSGKVPDRVFNVLFFYFLMVAFLSIIFLAELIRISSFSLPLSASLLICLFLFGYTITGRNRISRAFMELRTGEAKGYYQEMQQIFKLCGEQKNADIVLMPMKNRPNSIFSNDLHSQPDHWENRYFSIYHKIKSIRVDKTNSPYGE